MVTATAARAAAAAVAPAAEATTVVVETSSSHADNGDGYTDADADAVGTAVLRTYLVRGPLMQHIKADRKRTRRRSRSTRLLIISVVSIG